MCDEWLSQLTLVERGLLERLAAGMTLVAAAAAEFLSLRTANRRMAALRQRGGVKTTRELLELYREKLAGLHHELDTAVDGTVVRGRVRDLGPRLAKADRGQAVGGDAQ